jgi:hypothetical protein
MRYLDAIAAVAGICAFGLALYEAIGKGEYLASGICLAVFIACCVAFMWSRKAKEGGKPSHVQNQRSGAHSTNIQAGGNVTINSHAGLQEPGMKPVVVDRREQIREWRRMVTEVHSKQLEITHNGELASMTALLEQHPAFLSLRPLLSAETKRFLWGRTYLVPPGSSTMDGRLHAVLTDIERLEKEWGLR